MSDTECTTLERILAVASKEFLAEGFQGASLRSIVKKAGVTTGAFYGYFKSKEELFDALVQEQYNHILELYKSMLNRFTQLSPEEQRTDMASYSIAGMTEMTNYIYRHLDAFKLILCCSEGTPYEHLIHIMSEMDCAATHSFSDVMNTNGIPMNPIHPQLEHMLTSGMFCAYFEMVIHDIPKESAAEYTKQLADFYQAGWSKIMGF